MKRICILIFSALLLSSMLYAVTLEEIFSAAEKNSLTLQNATLTYNNNKLSEKANDLDKKVGIEVSTGDLSYSKTVDMKDNISHNIGLNPKVTVTLPNDGGTVITAGMGFNAKADGSSFTYSPNATVSHSFNFGYQNDDLEAYNNSVSAIQTESVYLNSLNSFRSSLLSQIKSLLNAELSLKKLEKSLADAEQDINNNITLQTYSKNSTSYKKAMLELEKSKASLASSKKQYESSKARFKNTTGLDWNGVENIPTVEIVFNPKDSGNSSVVLSSISAEIAKENIKVKESALNPNKLALSGGLSTSITDASSTTYSITPSVNATYTIGNITVGSNVSAKINDSSFLPSISFSFKWKNNTNSEKDEIELQKLQNSWIKAQNDYQQKLIDYNESVASLYQEIERYQTSLEEWKINKEYNQSILALEEELFSLGLSTEKKVNDIKFNMECAELEYQVLCLDGLILNLKVEAMSI